MDGGQGEQDRFLQECLSQSQKTADWIFDWEAKNQ